MSEIDDVIKILDDMTSAGVSRVKIETSDAAKKGDVRKHYHHGRCDVGSPFAKGKLYDLEDPGCN